MYSRTAVSARCWARRSWIWRFSSASSGRTRGSCRSSTLRSWIPSGSSIGAETSPGFSPSMAFACASPKVRRGAEREGADLTFLPSRGARRILNGELAEVRTGPQLLLNLPHKGEGLFARASLGAHEDLAQADGLRLGELLQMLPIVLLDVGIEDVLEDAAVDLAGRERPRAESARAASVGPDPDRGRLRPTASPLRPEGCPAASPN
jgi:hypothetical protein